jgi:hypothetical protein
MRTLAEGFTETLSGGAVFRGTGWTGWATGTCRPGRAGWCP